MTIGKKIQLKRQELGLYQSELANLVGVNQPQISRIEKGTRNPSIELLLKISKALKCDLNYFTEEASAWAESLMTSI